jgi:hypothetical protein
MVDDVRVANIEEEGFRFLTAWEADDGFACRSVWPSYFKAFGQQMPEILRVINKAEEDLLEIQLKLNSARKAAQDEIDAENEAWSKRQ